MGVPFAAVDANKPVSDKTWVSLTPMPAPPAQVAVFRQERPNLLNPNIPKFLSLPALKGAWRAGDKQQIESMLAARADGHSLITPSTYPHLQELNCEGKRDTSCETPDMLPMFGRLPLFDDEKVQEETCDETKVNDDADDMVLEKATAEETTSTAK
jgi:hypothetical protein